MDATVFIGIKFSVISYARLIAFLPIYGFLSALAGVEKIRLQRTLSMGLQTAIFSMFANAARVKLLYLCVLSETSQSKFNCDTISGIIS